MDTAFVLLILGNIICCLGTLLLIKTAIKNRNVLKDYDPIGATLTFLACALFNVAFVMMDNYLAFAFGLITVVFWAVVSIFGWRARVLVKKKAKVYAGYCINCKFAKDEKKCDRCGAPRSPTKFKVN